MCGFLSDLGEIVTAPFRLVSDTVVGVANAAGGAISGVASAGSQAVTGVVGGVSNLGGKVVDTAGGIANNFTSILSSPFLLIGVGVVIFLVISNK